MDPASEDKIAFHIDDSVYCYKVMSFKLKNVVATHQRLVNHIFKDQLGRNVEAYVDDMLVKSLKANDGLADLQETFDSLRRYNMKLNPTKCVFRVDSDKFLGYIFT